jgi:hypothetical protein
MPVEPRVGRELLDAFGVNLNRVFVTPEVGSTSAEPDDVVGGARIFLEAFPRLIEFCVKLPLRLGRKLTNRTFILKIRAEAFIRVSPWPN